MLKISEIIEKMKLATDDELCELELDLFALIYDKKDAAGIIECFLTLSNWVGFSLRDGVWSFYEYTNDESIEKVKAFLETKNWSELSDMYKLGISTIKWLMEESILFHVTPENPLERYTYWKKCRYAYCLFRELK